jgi:hypothetical protein
MTLRKKEFVPKRSLKTILTSLKDQVLDYDHYQSQPMYSVIVGKSKEHGKIIKQSH